jgi:hypothetical protein
VDSERTRRLFLTYYSRLIHVFTSPKYCYFSGFAAPTVRLLAGLREHVLSGQRLRPAHLAVMARLNMWTRCCELSVAQSVEACCRPGLGEELLARALGVPALEAGGGGGGTVGTAGARAAEAVRLMAGD